MTNNKSRIKYDDLDKIKRNEKGYRNLIIVSLIFFIPAVLGLIGFNLLILYATTNIFLNLLVEAFRQYIWIVNLGLIFVIGFAGLLLALGAWGLKSYKRDVNSYFAKIRPEFIPKTPPKKDRIIQFLTNNKGKAFTSVSLIKRLNYEGSPQNIESVLSELVKENIIKRTSKDNLIYYSI